MEDIISENSDESLKMLEEGIDVGILVLSGSADKSQKEHYENLREKSEKIFIVLNKSDTFSEENLDVIIKQWKEQLIDHTISVPHYSTFRDGRIG